MMPRTEREWDSYADAMTPDRDAETPAWSSIPCHCGARYRVAPWGEPARWQCETCEAYDEDAERTAEEET